MFKYIKKSLYYYINNMHLISFDVGIKNLAYCIIEVNDTDNTNYTVVSWGIICLIAKNVFNCDAKQCKKPYNICNKSATYIDKNSKKYCKQHSKASCEYSVCPDQFTDKNLKRLKLDELKELDATYKIHNGAPILKNDLLRIIMDYKTNHFLKKIVIPKVDMGLVTISINLRDIMNELLKSVGVKIDCVIIENQISKIASTMKTVQGMITQYFVMNNIENIHYISSSNKLKLFADPELKYTYGERKELGINSTVNEISDTQDVKWLELFNKHKKKDDLADCFLQGLWYINMKLRTT